MVGIYGEELKNVFAIDCRPFRSYAWLLSWNAEFAPQYCPSTYELFLEFVVWFFFLAGFCIADIFFPSKAYKKYSPKN